MGMGAGSVEEYLGALCGMDFKGFRQFFLVRKSHPLPETIKETFGQPLTQPIRPSSREVTDNPHLTHFKNFSPLAVALQGVK